MSSLSLLLRWPLLKVGAQRVITRLALGRATTTDLPWWEQSPAR
jgi:hypothetical protein